MMSMLTAACLGVRSIVVSLMFLKADVVYDSELTCAAEVRDAITDLGYPSQILEDSMNSNKKINLLVRSPARL